MRNQSAINFYFANAIPSIIPNSESLNRAFLEGAQEAVDRWSEARGQGSGEKSFADPTLGDAPLGDENVDIPLLFGPRTPRPVGPDDTANPCANGWSYYPHAQARVAELNGVLHATVQVYAQNGCALVDRNTNQILSADFHDTFAATSPYIIPENIENMYAHEMGHLYGLDHDSCAAGIMNGNGATLYGLPATTKEILEEHCELAERLNPPPPQADKPEDIYCMINPDSPLCTTSDGGGSGGSFGLRCTVDCTCVEVIAGWPPTQDPTGNQSLCINDPFAGALQCDPFDFIVLPDGSSSRMTSITNECQVDRSCYGSVEYQWSCEFVGGAAGRSGVTGSGPDIVIEQPPLGALVSGMVPVRVMVAEQVYGSLSFDVLIDGVPVDLHDDFARSETVGYCATFDDPLCPFVGFGGMLDTRQLPDGTHKIQVISERREPQLPFFTYAETTIEVRNQTSPPRPDIHVAESWGGHAQMPLGGHFSFGQRDLDDLPLVAAYLICNVGNDTLTLLNHGTMVTGEGFGRNFGGPASSLAPYRCSPIGVRFEATSPGSYTGLVDIRSDDPDEPSYTFSLSGEAVAPSTGPRFLLREVVQSIELPAEVPNGSTIDFGTVFHTLGEKRTFSMRNVGDSDLTISSVDSSGSCYWDTNPPVGVLPPGGAQWFSTTFLCLDETLPIGTYPGSLSIQTDDPAASPFTLSLDATLASNPNPRLWILDNADRSPMFPTSIVTYPDTPAGTPVSRGFAIKNLSGTSDLVIDNPTSLVSGFCFKQIGEPPASTVPPGGTTFFRVRMHCAAAGFRSGVVTVQANDPERPSGSLSFTVQGNVVP